MIIDSSNNVYQIVPVGQQEQINIKNENETMEINSFINH